MFGVLQQRCRQLASSACCTESRIPALGVGHTDIGGYSLPCQTALLLAVTAALGRVYRALELCRNSLLGNAGFFRKASGVNVLRGGGDALRGQDIDCLLQVVEPAVIAAQVVSGFCFFQLKFRGVGAAVEDHLKAVTPVFFYELVGVLGALIAQHADFDRAVGKQPQAALGSLLSCLVRIVAQDHLVGIFAEQLDLLGGQRRAAGADGGVEPGDVHGYDIHIAFAQNIALARGFFGDVQCKQCAGFVVDNRFGAVDVLGLGVIQHTTAEGNDRAAHVNDRHHNAVAEDIVQIALFAALDQPRMLQLAFGKAAPPQIMQQPAEILRRIAQPEAADGGIGQAALFFPVAAGKGSFGRVGVELLVKIAGSAAVDLQQALAGAGLLIVLLGQGHPDAGSQLLDALDIA